MTGDGRLSYHRRQELLPGETVWLVPINPSTPGAPTPSRMDLRLVAGNFLYGFHHGYGDYTYVPRSAVCWFFSEDSAKKAAQLLLELASIVTDDANVAAMAKAA